MPITSPRITPPIIPPIAPSITTFLNPYDSQYYWNNLHDGYVLFVNIAIFDHPNLLLFRRL